MRGDGERRDHGVSARARRERELGQKKLSGLLKVCHRFFDGFALGCGSGLGIQRDETTFLGRRKDSSEFHGNAPTGDWTYAFSRKPHQGAQRRRWLLNTATELVASHERFLHASGLKQELANQRNGVGFHAGSVGRVSVARKLHDPTVRRG